LNLGIYKEGEIMSNSIVKYIDKLTVDDMKKIIELCVEGDREYDYHSAFVGNSSILVVLRDRGEFSIDDFLLMSSYKTRINVELYTKYMYDKFGDEYVLDYMNSIYKYKIEELEEELNELKLKRDEEIDRLILKWKNM
jgi:hypothetical protein